jgi:hypothetical protein
MKIILTEDQYEQLTEMIKLDIKVGDTIMGGKFKNKKIVVKTIGKNDKGDITINGKPLLRFRIIKESASNDIEKRYKTYSKLLNELTETFDWVSKIDVKLSSTAAAGGWRDEDSKPLLIVLVYFKNYQKIRIMTQFELFDEISFIHDMFFPHLTGDPRIYSDNSDNVTAYFSTKSVFPNGKTDSFPSQNQIVSGDYDAVSQIRESNDKNKFFLKDKFGIDFTDKIKQITSTYDVPMEFDEGIGWDSIRRYLNLWGPMYLFELNGMKYLYQTRFEDEWFCNESGFDFVDNEIPEELGIDILGLKFSDIVDMYFEEGNPLNENVDKNKKFLISVMGMDFTDKIQQITSTHDVPTSFDDGIAPSTIRTYLNFWGPMYLVKIDGENYLYQDRGDFEMFIDEDGYWNKDEIPEKLGIGVLGLRFSDIVDMYFEEEDHR